MKITSTQFLFDGGQVVTFIRGSKEMYDGNHPRYQGKFYAYTVTVKVLDGTYTYATFQPPSQKIAENFLLKTPQRVMPTNHE